MGVLGDVHQNVMPMGREVGMFQKAVRLREGVLPNDVSGQAPEKIQAIDDFAGPLDLVQPPNHGVHDGLDARLESLQRSFGQVMGECAATDTVQVMIESDEEAMLQTKHLLGPGILFRSDVRAGIDLIDVFGVGDVDFIRADPDDGSC